jgi:hypothetical protein
MEDYQSWNDRDQQYRKWATEHGGPSFKMRHDLIYKAYKLCSLLVGKTLTLDEKNGQKILVQSATNSCTLHHNGIGISVVDTWTKQTFYLIALVWNGSTKWNITYTTEERTNNGIDYHYHTVIDDKEVRQLLHSYDTFLDRYFKESTTRTICSLHLYLKIRSSSINSFAHG